MIVRERELPPAAGARRGYAGRVSIQYMDPPPDMRQSVAERQWITEGPNSGGIGGWWLYRGHMFEFRQDFGDPWVGSGVPIAAWIEGWGERHPDIAASLAESRADG